MRKLIVGKISLYSTERGFFYKPENKETGVALKCAYRSGQCGPDCAACWIEEENHNVVCGREELNIGVLVEVEGQSL